MDACGSSPLTRGKHCRQAQHPGRAGLIPAHAGKTSCSDSYPASKRAHPRSRGENRRARARMRLARGSSPLTRGKPVIDSTVARRGRLIPAHAGKTYRRGAARSAARAHPRSRGENALYRSNTAWTRGSSPLTRGKRLTSILAALSRGLIPAHAGKTLQGKPGKLELRAHPRSRGENTTARVSGLGA